MKKSVVLCAYAFAIFPLLGLGGCSSEGDDSFSDKAVAIDSVEPPCAEPGSPSGYIEGNGFGAMNVTITVGGVEALVLAATGKDASFIVPEGLAPGPAEVVVKNPGGRIARIDWVICDAACTPTGPEVCDGLDNDCNELVDDGIADVVTGSDVGECQSEIQRCVDGALAIVQPGVGPSDEVCDALDNDCSGTADDGIDEIVTGTDVGECQSQIEQCVSGSITLVQAGIDPVPEECDNLDNDCSGTADDGIADIITGTDVGECQTGIDQCVGGTLVNVQTEIGPGLEQCDGLDNDCSGTPDDGIADIVTGIDTGECEPEIQSCVNGAFVITQFEVGPSPEECDGLDNDCNAENDDGIADIITGTDVGECQQEIQTCEGGGLVVVQAGVGPAAEQCDSLDNDCNGASDDGIADIITGTDVGECQPEIQSCVGGTLTLVQAGIGPSAETCDMLDNDCNGAVDDDPACGGGPNEPPILENPGSFAIVVGSSLEFQLSAMDANQDALHYMVTPLPLPGNATFDMDTGEFAFSPVLEDVGIYDLTFTVDDGEFDDSVVASIEVLPPPVGQTTELRGRVLDTNDYIVGVETPVVGATISLLGNPLETLTDSTGAFVITDIPGTSQILDINTATANVAPDGSPYAGFREEIQLIEDAVNDISRPFFLPRIDVESLTTVDPTTTTVVENPSLGVTLTVPPATAKSSNGANFTGQLSISLVPEGLAPAALPDFLEPGLLVTIQPVGVTFDPPVPITFPNVDNLLPGDEADIWSLDPEAGRFVVVGKGRVSEDGGSIETVDGGIRAADWHLPAPPPPDPPPPDRRYDKDDEDDENKTECDGSQVSMDSGNVAVDHELAPYMSLARHRILRLVYNSTSADPQPIVRNEFGQSGTASPPHYTSMVLRVAGIESEAAFLPSGGITARQFDAASFPTGTYQYSQTARNHYDSSVIGQSAAQAGVIKVNNQTGSPFGAGWTLGELQQLYVQGNGDVVVTEGSGTIRAYKFGASVPPDAGGAGSTPDFVVCGGIGGSTSRRFWRGPCDKYNSATKEYVGPANADRAELFYPTLSPDGELWGHVGRAFDTGESTTTVHRYSTEGQLIDQFVISGLVYDTTSTAVGGPYAVGRFPNSSFPQFRVVRYDRETGSAVGVIPWGAVGNCGVGVEDYNRGLFDAAPVNPPTDPDREEIYLENEANQLVKFDLTDTENPCRGVVLSRVPLLGGGSARLRVGLDGTPFIFVTSGNTPYPNGIYRVVSDTLARIIPLGNFALRDFSIGPTDGLIYGTTWGSGPSPLGPEGTILVYDSVTGERFENFFDPDGTQDYSTFYQLEFFPAQGAPPGYASEDRDFSTLIANEDGSFTRIMRAGKRIEFDQMGRHVATVDRNGNTISYEYNGDGQLSRIIDPIATLVTEFSYADDRVTRVTDPLGRNTDLVHDADGNLVRIVDPDGTFREFEYDERHRLIGKRDKRGQATLYEYGVGGRLNRRTKPGGTSENYAHVDTLALPDGANGAGTPDNPASPIPVDESQARFIDSDGLASTFGLTPSGQPTSVALSSGRSFNIQYDERGNPAGFTGNGDPGMAYVYDSNGNLTRATDRRTGGAMTLEWAPEGDVVSSIGKPDGVTSLERDQAGNVTKITSPEGRVVQAEYDQRGLPVRVVDRFGLVVQTGYDERANPISFSLSSGSKTRNTTITRSAEGHVKTITDAVGRVTEFDYDDLGRIVRVIRPGGAETTLAYDGDLLVGITPPGRPTHFFQYSGDSRLEQYQPPDLGEGLSATEYTLEKGRRVGAVTTPDGETAYFEYDAIGRLSQRTLPDAEIVHTYRPIGADAALGLGADGLLSSLATSAGSLLEYTHQEGLIVGRTWSGVVEAHYARTFDIAGRIASETINQEPAITFAYDRDSLRVRAGELVIVRDPSSGLISSTMLRGVSDLWEFNAFGEVVGYSATAAGTPLYATSYQRDALGRIEEVSETVLGDTVTKEYSYTLAGPLESALTVGSNSQSYSYDQNGNRTTGPNGEGSTYDDQDRLLVSGPTEYAYSGVGQRVLEVDTDTSEETSYAYDGAGNLQSVSLPDGTVVDYVFDGYNRRIARMVDGTTTRGFIYRNRKSPVAEIGPDNEIVSVFVYGTRPHVPDYIIQGTSAFRIITDHLGTVRLVVNADTGEVTQRLDFDEFGNVLNDTNPGFQPFGFVGGIYDPLTDLTHFGWRDYDARTGRFLTKDPLKFRGKDTNLYRYAVGDPINHADPGGYNTQAEQELLDAFEQVLFNMPADGMRLASQGALAGWWNNFCATQDGCRILGKSQFGPELMGCEAQADFVGAMLDQLKEGAAFGHYDFTTGSNGTQQGCSPAGLPHQWGVASPSPGSGDRVFVFDPWVGDAWFVDPSDAPISPSGPDGGTYRQNSGEMCWYEWYSRIEPEDIDLYGR